MGKNIRVKMACAKKEQKNGKRSVFGVLSGGTFKLWQFVPYEEDGCKACEITRQDIAVPGRKRKAICR